MAIRKTARVNRTGVRRPTRKREPDTLMRRLSAIIGGVLICATLAWFGWLLVRQHNPGLAAIRFSFPGPLVKATPQTTVDPLIAAGITLSVPDQGQTPQLTEQQALVLANQMEPQAAAHAGSVDEEYVLFNYKGSATTTASMHDVPAWQIHYSKVAMVGPDTAADPHATKTSHDCYLFLDANSGQELLALWV